MYVVTDFNRFSVLYTLETLEAAKEFVGECPRSQSGFTLVETLESIEERHAARLPENCDQYRPDT